MLNFDGFPMLKNITNSNRQERSAKFFYTQILYLALTTGSRTPGARLSAEPTTDAPLAETPWR